MTREAEADSYGALRPRDRDTIEELLDAVLPDDPRADFRRRARGSYGQSSQLLRLKAPGLTLSVAPPVDHEFESIEHLFSVQTSARPEATAGTVSVMLATMAPLPQGENMNKDDPLRDYLAGLDQSTVNMPFGCI